MSQMTVCKYSNSGGFFGEISIEDIRIFPESDSPLFDVEQMWQATKKYAILINDSLGKAVSATSAKGMQDVDLEMEEMRLEEHDQCRRAQDILLHGSIFTMQCAFMEYALKRVYAVAIKTPPLPQIPCFNKHILIPLKSKTLILAKEHKQLESMHADYGSIRNAYAHGDWSNLYEKCKGKDLYEFFMEIGRLLYAIKQRMSDLQNSSDLG